MTARAWWLWLKGTLALKLAWLLNWFDPDRKWFAPDKYQHCALGICTGIILKGWPLLLVDNKRVMLLSFLVALAWEGGQADTAHSVGKLGQPGYGISPLDISWHMLGTMVLLFIWRYACGM